MNELFEYQEQVSRPITDKFLRSLYHNLDWDSRFLGITGLRGVGKTTMLLQYLKFDVRSKDKALYITADHPWFYDHTLLDVADQFSKYGGNILLIDEIHRYPNWSAELKNIYDGYPKLQVIFTASAALQLLQGEADLSRRVLTRELPGLSFREFLNLRDNHSFSAESLDNILNHPKKIADSILSECKPLPAFQDYLQSGYFPFSITKKKEAFLQLINQVINTVMEVDLQVVEGYSASNTLKMKKLLGVISESAPFEPNISKIASRLEMGRDTVKTYLNNLDRARLLNLLSRSTKGVAALQKPDKIYLENSNFSHALRINPERGTIRETFFLNQLRNAGYSVSLAASGDFIVDGSLTFEIGGQNKTNRQIADKKNAYLALDDLEHPHLNRIPLWLFGFLY